MAIVINEENSPMIEVKFTSEKFTDENYNEFLSKWTELYENGVDFCFMFDTCDIREIPHIKYSLGLCIFIKNLKKRYEHQYLKYSTIKINDNKIKYLLDFIFTIQKPVAPVKIINQR